MTDTATAPAARVPVMRSPAHRLHAAMGGVFERRGAWDVPVLYGTGTDELASLENGLGFADVSARGKVHLGGAVDGLVRALTAGTVEPLGTAPLTDGGTVARFARDWAMAMIAPGQESAVLAKLGSETADAMATDVTSGMCAFLVAGPRLDDFLARTLTMDRRELKAGRCAAATWSRIPAALVALNMPTPAVELYVSSDHGRYAWETICRLAEHLEGAPVGWRALDTWGWR
jgi:glycine cleavage system aminomethyltransferase T